MKLMDSLKPYLSLAIVALLAANLVVSWNNDRQLQEQMKTLLDSQSKLQSAVASSQTQINQLSGSLQEELERQASLFSENSTTVSYSAEGYVVTTTLTPKEYNTDSKLTVTCTVDGKTYSKEAAQNGSEFVAVCVVPFCENIDISAAITTGEEIHQEPLPSIPCQTLLAFDIYTEFSYDDSTLYFTVSNPQGTALLESLTSINLAVERDSTVIGAVYPQAITTSELPDSMKGSSACLCYAADMSPFMNLEGELHVLPRIQSSTGLAYAQDSMFTFTVDADGLDSYESGESWYPALFN